MDLQAVYEKLGLKEDCLIRTSDKEWKKKASLPSRICRLLEKNKLLKTLDAFFCFDNKPLILFYENPANLQALHRAIWNFNESPIIIIINHGDVEIWNGFAIDRNTKLLKAIGKEEKLDDFSYFELVTGKTWEKYNVQIQHENRVDYFLLHNIDEARKILITKENIHPDVANALIGKIIFIRYLIDRQVRLNYNGKEYWGNDDLCLCLGEKEHFEAFIKYIESKEHGFNGDMFRITPEQFKTISQKALNVLIRLLRSEDIGTGQFSLFDLYDFSILPIEFISNIYEKFIGKENQDKESAYYTPTFLVDYVIDNTVESFLKKNGNACNCRVLDPACGSGIFLVESLRRIIEKYIEVHEITNTSTDLFKEALKTLATENIFGIDTDFSAIQVAVFSIYLTLLDYQQPADIENFQFPNLMETNFICCDTFDENNDHINFLTKKQLQFDYILGNPPWQRGRIERDAEGKKKTPLYELYLKKNTKEKIIGNKELAQAFVIRSLDFASANTKFAFILPSKALYNINSLAFRHFMLENMFMDQVFELAAVRKEVFDRSNDPAIAPACILFYRQAKGENTDNHLTEHIALKPTRFFSLFKIFTLTRNDIQEIKQGLLKANDWAWKVLVYGSYLDYNFIARLKQEFPITINDRIGHTKQFIIKQGLKEKDGNKAIDVTALIGKNYIKTKHVQRGYITDSKEIWTKTTVGYTYKDFDIYKAPVLLITGGTTNDLRAVAAISYQDGVYKSSLTGIKGYGKDSIPVLQNIEGELNSTFFTYYNLMTFSSSGIEREETHDEEKWSLPYCDAQLSEIVSHLSTLRQQYHSAWIKDNTLGTKIKEYEEQIDNIIYKHFKCSAVELDLIDFAKHVSVPLAVKSNGYKKVFAEIRKDDTLLRNYAQVYIDRFAPSFTNSEQHFVVEVVYTKYVIGMFFKIVPLMEYKEDFYFARHNDALLTIMLKLSSENLTDRLYVQKDIRGFEEDSFYIIKPNERRLWHRAIAHLDANEFADAMLKKGGEI